MPIGRCWRTGLIAAVVEPHPDDAAAVPTDDPPLLPIVEACALPRLGAVN
jgi:hypothetical protein